MTSCSDIIFCRITVNFATAAAVLIQATDYVTVHVANVGDWSTGVYLALPLDVTGSIYYVMSFVSRGQTASKNPGPSQLAVISTSDNAVIEIDLPDNVDLAVTDTGLGMSPISRHFRLTLNKYQTLQVTQKSLMILCFKKNIFLPVI
jgi:hypothetical protein